MQQMPHKSLERSRLSSHEREKSLRPFRQGIHIAQFILAIVALFCQVFIFWLLSFPYVYEQDAYTELITSFTGWNFIGSLSILSLFLYLLALIAVLRGWQINRGLKIALYCNALLTPEWLFLTWLLMQFDAWRLSDGLHDITWQDNQRLVVLVLFAISTSICSGLLGWLFQREQWRQENGRQ